MNKKNLVLKNSIQKKYIDSKLLKKLSKDFNNIIEEVNKETSGLNKTLNILNKNFKLNFKIKDLKKFKQFKIIAFIGMGGSILGAEAINNFLEKKIKKKIYFFDNLDIKKISKFKKKENQNKVLFLIISKSGSTVETLSNFFTLNIIKKNAKNIILYQKKKTIYYFLYQKNLIYFTLNIEVMLEVDTQCFQKLASFHHT